ncbi:hypothetical protein B0T18DRAFT_312978 [Schizothecium vesticola]|uniref:Glycoside hydrolase 131 catalytic N-terminal domain-containing protein n=1 Tax=Schizothecium vesticola TaxID=314040 RepID=A0AA40KCK3_9PEZI|nr:hypothetical protein B0T18DRAFT_312978 [Schizothecium vesticola]
MHASALLGLALASVTATARNCARAPSVGTGVVKCPIVFDGRVAAAAAATDFDSYGTSKFNAEYVKGKELKWSDIIKFPADAGSARFDTEAHKAFEVTISDKSIFQTQNGFRRAGLQFQGDTNTASPASSGVKTLHFSLKWDAQRALNLSHEYLNVWHEAADYSSNQFNFQAGQIIGQSGQADTWKLLDRRNKLLWSTPIDKKAWQNFAITLDYSKNTLQVYYSINDEPLKSAASAFANDNSGNGQFQIGILKKPTGTSDVVNSGFQSKNLNEGLIYGSLFVEDSAGGCVSL